MRIRHPALSPPGHGRAVLVLLVLAGVLAMHAFAFGSSVPAPMGTAPGHSAVAVHDQTMGHADSECPHPCGGGSGGHLDHADPTCTADGLATTYTPPTPAAAGVGTVSGAAVVLGRPGPAAVACRAPPDLAQLQLLRI